MSETEEAPKAARMTFVAKSIAWVLMLSASLFNLLNFNGYPLIRAEVGLLLGAFIIIGGALALVEYSGPKIAFALTALLVLLGVDFNTENSWASLAAGLAALVLARFNNAAVVKLVIAAFGAVTLFQLGGGLLGGAPAPQRQQASATPSDPSLPPVVHLLMDSYVGTEGMSAEPAMAPLRADVVRFYTDHGFRLYDGAYSRHANTANSVPYLLSFGTAKAATESQRVQRVIPDRLAYFNYLQRRGYEISVLGANFIDLCTGQPIAECDQFAHSDLSALTRFDLSAGDRAKTIALTLAGFSTLTAIAHDLGQFAKVELMGGQWQTIRNLKKVGSLRSALAMRDLERTLGGVQNGHAYFIHLLMPHEPYVFDADCEIRPRSAWSNEQTPGTRAERIADYSAQLRCTNALLGAMLASLDATPDGKRAIVIVHGDHGSRIVNARPTVEQPRQSLPDYAMTYSALFAIRAPGIAPGTVEGRASLDELLKDFSEADFEAAPPAGRLPSEIILATRDWVPKKRAPLPEYGSR